MAAHPDGATLRLRVVPRASRTALVGRHGDAVKLKVAAPPVDGAANDAVIAFVAELAGVRRSDVSIVAGERSRSKVVLVAGVGASALRRRLREV